MSVVLRKRKNADGTTTLRLDIYHNGQRKIETLKHLKLAKPSNLLDREQNKQRMQQAEEIAVTRAAELEANNYSMVTDAGKKTIITVWMQSYVDGYTKKDKRNMQGALNRFIAFLTEDKKTGLTFGNLNALLIEDFIEFLEANSTGEGALSYYNRFKKMIKQAYRKKLMKDNVLDFVERKIKGKAKKKDVLTLDELKILSATHTESSEIRIGTNLQLFILDYKWIEDYRLASPIYIDRETEKPKPKLYYWSNEAKKYFYKWQKENPDTVNENADTLKGEIFSKYDIHFARLSLVLQVMNDYTKSEISLQAVEGAEKLCTYFQRNAMKVLQILESSTFSGTLPQNKIAFYNSLPDRFITGEANVIGERLEFNIKAVQRFLNDDNLFAWIAQGQYSKKIKN